MYFKHTSNNKEKIAIQLNIEDNNIDKSKIYQKEYL
jgi:hypothetical protein